MVGALVMLIHVEVVFHKLSMNWKTNEFIHQDKVTDFDQFDKSQVIAFQFSLIVEIQA